MYDAIAIDVDMYAKGIVGLQYKTRQGQVKTITRTAAELQEA